MELDLPFFTLAKVGLQFVKHKALQLHLGTTESIIRDTKNGRVKGYKRHAVYGETYYAFEMVPYGKPPIGDLRFKAPQPAESWDGVKDCTKAPNKPYQRNMVHKLIEGTEKCLFVNIYTKTFESPKRLPVMVWIYGGGFQTGEATRDLYAPDYFMKEDVVLVEISYRLGALGYLSLSDPELDCPGNAGLKDQLLAMKWIKENIENFNGDPNNITLFGESAGGSSTHTLMLTDKAKGLFHKAILQSGTNFCEWTHGPQADRAYRLAVRCGFCGSNNEREIFEFLKNLEASKIVDVQNDILNEEEIRDNAIYSFGPVIEPYESDHSLLTKPIKDLVKTAWSNDIPVVLGGTSFEGLFSYLSPFKHKFLINDIPDCVRLLPKEIRESHSEEELLEMGSKIKEVYFNGKEPSLKESLMQYLDVMSYKQFWLGIHKMVVARMLYASQSPTYLYRFDFDSKFMNSYRILKCGPKVRGVSHADDISYLFYTVTSTKLHEDVPEYKAMRQMVGMWVAFARSSDPNIESIKPAIWKPVTDNEKHLWKCLNISRDVDFIDLPEASKLALWESFYDKIGLL